MLYQHQGVKDFKDAPIKLGSAGKTLNTALMVFPSYFYSSYLCHPFEIVYGISEKHRTKNCLRSHS